MKRMLLLLAAVSIYQLLYGLPASQKFPKPILTPISSPTDTLGDELQYSISIDTSHHLQEVVVSANRFEQQRKDVPQATEIIQANALAFDNLQTSADVIQHTGNILVQKSQQGGGSPVIRGFETNKILLVIDGVRMNNAIYRAGHLQNIVTLDNAAMDKVEILYGPGSVMYGSDALGGVLHFFSKNPVLSSDGTLLTHGQAWARYATANDETTGHVDLSLGGRKLGSLTSITYSDFGDLRQGAQRRAAYPDFGKRPFYAERQNGEDVSVVNDDPDLQVGSGYKQYDILQKLIYQTSDEVTHTLNVQYSTSSDVPRYDRLTQTTGADPRYSAWYYGPQKRFFSAYSLNLNHAKGILGKGKIVAAYQQIEESRHDRRFKNNNLNHRIEKLDILTLNLDFTKQHGASSWSYGLEGTYDKVNSTAHREDITTGEKTPLDTRYPDGGSTVSTAALYVSNAYTVTPHFLLQGGLRLGYHTLTSKFEDKTFFPFPYDEATQNNTVLTGSLGTVLNSANGWRLSFVSATGFRTPSVDDMSKVFESVPGSVIVPNPDLGPEHTYNLDFTLAKSISNTYEVGVGGYYTWYRDAVTVAPGTFEGQSTILYEGDTSQVITNVNANKAYIYGMNAYVSMSFSPALSLYSTINYTYGRIETDTTPYPLDHIPPVFGKTSLRWSHEKFKGEIYAMYNGWKKLKAYNLVGEDNFAYATPEGMPSWMTLNIKGAYQLSDSFVLQAGVENIADTNYRVFSSNISAPGRNFMLTLRARW